MNFIMPTFSLASPEIAMLIMVGFILLVDVFCPERFRIVTYLLVQATLIIAFLLAIPQYRHNSELLVTFNGHYVVDKLAILLKLFIYVNVI